MNGPPQRLSIMLVEDNPGDARLLRMLLEEVPAPPFELHHAARLGDALALLERRPDVVLLDLGLPDSQGLATFERLQAAAPDCPVIISSGLDDEQTAVQAVALGAQDYLVKGQIDAFVLHRAIRYAIERKRAQVEIERLNADLEQRVQQRTAELAAANQELEAFSYSVSHDLRAPLRHIQGYVELLADATRGQLSATAERFLRTIGQASVEMGQLIDDLLQFSRMSRSSMELQPVELSPLLAEVRQRLQLACRDRAVEWLVDPLPRVLGDRPMLRQVLANLLDNALKYSRGRSPARIEVGCVARAEAGPGRVVLFVRDNGAGFDMRYAHQLFGVFQRLHHAEQFEGTGIGLATVQRIIARHGGQVWAESVPGQGATFYFTLARAQSS